MSAGGVRAMSTEPTEVDEPLAEDHGPFDWMSGELHALDQLMSRVGGHPSRVDELAIEVELETAREELRVADEEMRVQRDQLEELLGNGGSARPSAGGSPPCCRCRW